jgi:hypothetical protein
VIFAAYRLCRSLAWEPVSMTDFPCLERWAGRSGEARYRLGDPLVDRYLEFVAGRARPNTLRAVAFDLKAFFAVVGKDPVEVTAADVFEFLADQRGDRTVVRLADRESGLSARTIARRLSSVSGLYAYLVARGDTPVQVNPVPRGLSTRRQGGSDVAHGAAGAGAAHVAQDLGASGGGPAARRVADAPGHRDGVGDAAGRTAPVRSLLARLEDVQVADRRLSQGAACVLPSRCPVSGTFRPELFVMLDSRLALSRSRR